MNANVNASIDVLVDQHQVVAKGVVHMVLKARDGGELPAWSPGAHIDVFLPGSLVRQYSLCGDPQQRDRYEIAVLDELESRGGSRFLCRELAAAAELCIGFPRQLFPLQRSANYFFIAGGIGITPLLPMLREATACGANWQLLYGGRSRDSMAFAEALVHAYGERVHVAPQDASGLLDLDRWIGKPMPNTLVYACGPEALLQAVEARCAQWPAGSLHTERFAPKPMNAIEDDRPLEVVLKRSGQTLSVPPGTSILEAAEAAGVSCLSACGQGTCGTCWTRVLEGVPDHRDSLLDDEQRDAGDQMLICVSRAKTPRLVIDL